MANENQNTGPNTQGPERSQTRQTIADIKEVKSSAGDFNDILKDSISNLKKISALYDDIEARLNTMEKSSLNVKEINTQLFKAKQKDAIVSKKLQDAEKDLGAESELRMKNYKDSRLKISELEQRQAKYERLNLKDKAGQVSELIAMEIARNERLRDGLTTTELEVISLRESEEYTKAIVELAKQKLKQEKEVRRELGYSGAAMGLFAKKLGLGNEIYEQMVEKAKTLKDQGKSITFLDKLSILGKGAATGFVDAITDPLTMIPLAGAAIGGFVKGLKSALDYILEIQDKTVKFARAMNLSTAEARQIKMEFASISVSSGDLFITSQKMVESQMEFVDALGITNTLTNEQLATNIKLKDITGLDLETRKGIVEASTITGQSSEKLTKSVLAQVVGLKNATGISFQYQRILKEASNLGGYLGLSFAKYPAQLTKSLLTVKAMGMELKQLDSLADSFLDFESSISKEFEAQLLTGKDINLAKAREAFLNNDLATAAQEITSQVGSAADFLKLNRIQAESLASAFGMSRDQMGEMLKQQELLSKLGAKQGDSAKEQLRLGLERYKNQKALVAAVGEEAYQSLVNASAQEKIGAFMEKIKQSIADFVEKSGIIEKLEGFFDYLSKPENIKKVIEGVRDFFASAVEFIGKAAYYILEGLDYVALGQIPDDFIDSIKSGAENMGAQIRSLGGDLGGVSVGANAATSQVRGSTVATQDNMSMGGSAGGNAPNQTFYFVNKNEISDTAKAMEDRLTKAIPMDRVTGQ